MSAPSVAADYVLEDLTAFVRGGTQTNNLTSSKISACFLLETVPVCTYEGRKTLGGDSNNRRSTVSFSLGAKTT